jgi:hypothetical protein
MIRPQPEVMRFLCREDATTALRQIIHKNVT